VGAPRARKEPAGTSGCQKSGRCDRTRAGTLEVEVLTGFCMALSVCDLTKGKTESGMIIVWLIN